MKRNRILTIFASLFVAVAMFSACTEDTADVRLEPTLSTSNTLNVTSDSATVVGFVIAEGDGFTERGICYSTSENPTVDDSRTIYSEGSATATFHVTLSGLNYATTYYAKAYATGEAGTVYGEQVTFTTLPVVPFITTAAITDVTGNSATGGGEVTGSGGSDVTARGICFGTSENPTTADGITTDGDGTGAFESMLSELQGNTTYYVRAYATNSAGTGYGPQVSFTTEVDLPKLTTTGASEITKTSAVTGGAVTNNGGGEITSYGIVWGMNPEPTTADNTIEGTMEMDSFVIDITNLDLNTTYYVRAFATNSAGTGYGENIEFTTLANILTWYIPGDYVEASYPGSDLSNWSPENSPYIQSTIDNGSKLEGYIYMGNTNNQWKFATQPNWSGPNYGDGGGGVLDANADNIQSTAGYYKLTADADAGTFTAARTVWGVIGSASPLGWDDETPLTYSPENKRWQGVMHLTAAEIKFRANHDPAWTHNYGSNAADGTLQHGGSNIPVKVESDYVIILDLSTPNEYTYTLNRWGLIGDATPGGWNDDTNMIWDAENGVFTVTLNLLAGSIKFRADDDWALSLGGALDNLSSDNAPNIAISEAGNYTITLDPWGLTATVTKN